MATTFETIVGFAGLLIVFILGMIWAISVNRKGTAIPKIGDRINRSGNWKQPVTYRMVRRTDKATSV